MATAEFETGKANDEIVGQPANKMALSGNKMAASDEMFDVVVVGAGLAGLSTIYSLLKKDPMLKVLVLEARDRVGGRTVSLPMGVRGGQTEDFDFGAQWVGVTQHHVIELLKQLNIDTFKQDCQGTKVTQISSNKVRTFTSDSPTIGSWFAQWEYNRFMASMDRLSQQVPMEDPYTCPFAHQLEAHTVTSYANLCLWTKAAKDAVEQSVKAVYGTDGTRLGMLFFLAYTNASGGMGQLYGIKESAQEYRIKEGTQHISKRLAAAIGHHNIQLLSPVTAIHQSDQDGIITVHFERISDPDHHIMGHGQPGAVRASKVVVAAPPNLVKNITFRPPLHTVKQLLNDSLLMGHLYKFTVTYEKSHWKAKGFSGEMFSSGGVKVTSECTTGPLCEAYDATTFSGAPAIVGFFAGRTAIEWTNKTKLERSAAVIASLVECLGPEMAEYVEYQDKMWMTDPWAGGCPVTYGTPGTMFAMPYIRAPHGSVHFAGTETALVWMGYMSGAIESGQRASLEVLAAIRPHLLTEAQVKEAKRTSIIREPFFAQPPSSVSWRLLTVFAVAGVAATVAYLLKPDLVRITA